MLSHSLSLLGSSANSELANGTGSSGPSATHEFQLTYKKGKKNDNMRFSSEWRSTILTEVWAQLQKHTNNDSPDAIQATKVNTLIFYRMIRYCFSFSLIVFIISNLMPME